MMCLSDTRTLRERVSEEKRFAEARACKERACAEGGGERGVWVGETPSDGLVLRRVRKVRKKVRGVVSLIRHCE